MGECTFLLTNGRKSVIQENQNYCEYENYCRWLNIGQQATQAKSLEFACLFVLWLLIGWFCLFFSYCFDCGFCGFFSFLILFSCCFCLGLLLLLDTALYCALRISQEAILQEKQANDSLYPWRHLRGRLPRCTLRLCWEGNTGRFQNTIDFLINLSERFQIKVRWNRSWNHRAKENQWKTRGNGRWVTCAAIDGPSSSCEMIILRSNSHGRIIRVRMGIFTTALRNKKIRQILDKNTSPYFHSASLVIWLLTMLKGTHVSELSISKFSKGLFWCT